MRTSIRVIFSIALMSMLFASSAQANIIMDTRIAEIYFSVDDQRVDRQYILRTEHDYKVKNGEEKVELLFTICESDGTCGTLEEVKHPDRFRYFLEKMPEVVPDDITTLHGYEKILNYYNENKADIELSVDVTSELQAVDSKPSKEVINYFVDIDSETEEISVSQENLGTYDPLAEIADKPLTTETKKQLALPILVGVVILILVSIGAVKLKRSMSKKR